MDSFSGSYFYAFTFNPLPTLVTWHVTRIYETVASSPRAVTDRLCYCYCYCYNRPRPVTRRQAIPPA